MRRLPPAIPNQEPIVERRIWEINERVTVFDDIEHERMAKHCNHIVKGCITGQLSLEGCFDG